MMMRLGDILGRIFFMLSQKSIIGIYPRSTRIFLVATLEIFEEIFV